MHGEHYGRTMKCNNDHRKNNLCEWHQQDGTVRYMIILSTLRISRQLSMNKNNYKGLRVQWNPGWFCSMLGVSACTQKGRGLIPCQGHTHRWRLAPAPSGGCGRQLVNTSPSYQCHPISPCSFLSTLSLSDKQLRTKEWGLKTKECN